MSIISKKLSVPKLFSKLTSNFNSYQFGFYHIWVYIEGFDGVAWQVPVLDIRDPIGSYTWKYFTVCGDGSTLYVMLDGTNLQTKSYTTLGDAGGSLYIGKAYNDYNYSGYLNDLYFEIGTAHYTNTFTTPTELKINDLNFANSAQSSILFNGTLDGSDFSLSTTAGSLTVRKVSLENTENLATAVYEPCILLSSNRSIIGTT